VDIRQLGAAVFAPSTEDGPELAQSSDKGNVMNKFTGQVLFSDHVNDWCFQNDDGTADQRLTTASVGQDPSGSKIDLSQYKDQYLLVEGVWEHAWIYNASVLQHSDSPIEPDK
jgi:hypothetical protein